MKILIVGDIHWSTYSSIVRNRGKNFSIRLEHLIRSLNWVEQISREENCDEEVFLGDTFDKPELSAEEITALSEIDWNKDCRLRHFLVGNHESGVSSLKYNSAQALHKVGVIEDTAYFYPLDDKTEFLFLPYVLDDSRISLEEKCKDRNKDKKLIVFSHNDIKDFQMGMFLSKTGYAIDDIEANCDLYINGHLHNGGWVTKKILNLGVLCGQNFSEDATRYEHRIAILDTDTLELKFYVNPYSFNFYKIDIDNKTDIEKELGKLKDNAVVSFRCIDKREPELRNLILKYNCIISYKVVVYSEELENDDLVADNLTSIDHLKQFKEFILEQLGTSKVVQEELYEICQN